MELILLVVMGVLLVFMFISSRRRAAKMKLEQEAKARAMVPGVKVLLQGGLYGTLISYDGEDLSKSAFIELAPGVPVEVHSQAILRVVDPEEGTVTTEELVEAEEAEAEYLADVADGTLPPADEAATRRVDGTGADGDDKPRA
jgi:preprotein translocase subunit YajC